MTEKQTGSLYGEVAEGLNDTIMAQLILNEMRNPDAPPTLETTLDAESPEQQEAHQQLVQEGHLKFGIDGQPTISVSGICRLYSYLLGAA